MMNAADFVVNQTVSGVIDEDIRDSGRRNPCKQPG